MKRIELGSAVEFHVRGGPHAGQRLQGRVQTWLGGDYYEILASTGTVHRRYGKDLTTIPEDLLDAAERIPATQREPEDREI
jgi:hypothetical protein